MPRSPAQLADQLRRLREHLASAFTVADAYALAPGGSVILMGGTKTRGNARFHHAVLAQLKEPGRYHLWAHCPAALALLPPRVRWVLVQTYQWEQTEALLAWRLRVTPRRVRQLRHEGLERLAELLWTANGEPQIPRGAAHE